MTPIQKPGKNRLLIADDHGVVRKGLRLLLEQYKELEVPKRSRSGSTSRRSANLAPTASVTRAATSCELRD